RGVKVTFANSRPEYLDEMEEVFRAFGCVPNRRKGVVTTENVRLGELLLLAGHGAKVKFIPRFLLTFHPRYLKVLFDTLMKGDGSNGTHRGNHITYYTSSVPLRDSFIELCFRLG